MIADLVALIPHILVAIYVFLAAKAFRRGERDDERNWLLWAVVFAILAL